MAPEQLEGKATDARSDVFAFGAVLSEMTTGTRAFTGKTQASVIASIMASEPRAMSEIQPMTPQGLDRLVRKCLRKDPDARWQSVHDITDELKWIAESISYPSAPRFQAGSLATQAQAAAWCGRAPRFSVSCCLPRRPGSSVNRRRHLSRRPFSFTIRPA